VIPVYVASILKALRVGNPSGRVVGRGPPVFFHATSAALFWIIGTLIDFSQHQRPLVLTEEVHHA
jgi:hypothetical protein